MKKLFENWRDYTSKTLLIESRMSDAKKEVIRGLDKKYDDFKVEPPQELHQSAQEVIDYLQNYIGGLESTKHLVGFAKIVNRHVLLEFKYPELATIMEDYVETQIDEQIGDVLKLAAQAYEYYTSATNRNMQISEADFYTLQGDPVMFNNEEWIAPGRPETAPQMSPHLYLKQVFPHIVPDEVAEARGLGYRTGTEPKKIKGPIQPITNFLGTNQKGFLVGQYSWDGTVLELFNYFGFFLKEHIRRKGYKKDPKVKQKAKETSAIVVDNQFYSIIELRSMQAGCVLGCSTWCISQTPTRAQEEDPELDDPGGNRFNLYKKKGDTIYIIDFKFVKAHKYKKVSMQFNVNEKIGEPYEVIDCGTNQDDNSRGESAIEVGVKLNLLSYAGVDITRPQLSGVRSAADLVDDFQQFLRDSQKTVKTFKYEQQLINYGAAVNKLGIKMDDIKGSPQAGGAPAERWRSLVVQARNNIVNLTKENYLPMMAKNQSVRFIMGMVKSNFNTSGIWNTILEYPRTQAAREVLILMENILGWAKKNNMKEFDQILERLTQTIGDPNIGAARNLLWDLTTRYDWGEVIISRGNPQDIISQITEQHWDWEFITKAQRPDAIRRWVEMHSADLAQEIIEVLITINPATLIGMLSRAMGRELDTMGVSAWLANSSNRELLAAEIRRILEQNVEAAASLGAALAQQNPALVAEKTWELVYQRLGTEIGFLIDRLFDSDEERALELARQRDRLRENKNSIGRVLISIRR